MTTINAKLEEKCIVDMEGDGREVVELIAAIVYSLALNMGFDYHKVMKDIYGVLERNEHAGILDRAKMMTIEKR